MKRFKSPWFYWHTGQTRIALTSLAASGILSGLVLTLLAGCSVWAILLAVLFDAASLLLALVYLLVLRWSIPEGLGVQAYADLLALEFLLLPALVGLILNRGCAFLVAKRLGYPFAAQTASDPVTGCRTRGRPMSLQRRTAFEIPSETRLVALAAFPHGTLCLQSAEHFGTLYADERFADLFPRRGQPAEAPGRLAWVTVLPFIEDLSDRAAADAVRSRLDWKYLLGLELTDPGFDHTVLSEFRARMVKKQAEPRLLDDLLQQLQEPIIARTA